jgi:hypothetical protein
MKKLITICLVVVCMAVVNFASAEIIRGIGMDFVSIGNAGNAGDTRGGGYANPYGCGAVNYIYRIGKYEVTNAQWDAFTAAAGAPTGNDGGYSYPAQFTGAQQPTNKVSWYEAAQFCNYLTSGDKSKGAYHFYGDNANPGSFLGIDRTAAQATYSMVYVIPTEDEWYKAAYYKPNGSGYSLYANGLDTIPAADNGWNYLFGAYDTPWDVGTGAMEQNGTFDMMGNVWEWNETLILAQYSGLRGGAYAEYPDNMASYGRYYYNPYFESFSVGFRVVSLCPSADLTGDCVVDMKDFALFASQWLRDDCVTPDWCGGADFDKSGKVGMEDLAELMAQWL